MSKLNIANVMSRKMYGLGFSIKKHSPELLLAAGIAGVITSTVLACKATTKLESILEKPKADIEKIHELMDKPELVPAGETYTDEDCRKDLTIVYTQSAIKVAKLYAPAVIIGGLSIAAILGGHNILNKRNAALAAAYATIDQCFKDYRGRIVEKFGADLDKEIRYNVKAKEVEEKAIDSKGKEKTVKKSVDVANINEVSDFARFFDDGCEGWTKDPEANLMFLKNQQRYADDLLKTRGYLFLNEVYDALGIPRTQAGQVVGWIYDESNPVGDNYVDFGIYNYENSRNRDFVNGYERTILLDFNVDGNILDRF